MIRELTNHLWQSTVFAILAAALALAFRKNRASVRYWMWFAASAKFLVAFALLISLGSLVEPKPTPKKMPKVGVPSISYAVVEIAPENSMRVPSRPRVIDWPSIALGVWACGALTLLLMRVEGWRRIRAAIAASTPVELSCEAMEIRESPGRLEPGVVGILRPVLLLPVGIRQSLSPRQFDAVLAHEMSHVRRRDNLLAAVHMVVEAIFWFHPLVWYIGAKLVEERELACDESVLETGSEPAVYAEGILNVCKMYVESPLPCVSGISGADLKRRIHAILDGSASIGLTRARKIALACAAAAAVAAPIVIGVTNAPWIRAQSAAASRPQFEVASVRACDGPGGGGARGGAKGGGRNGSAAGAADHPGTLYLACIPLGALIQDAYVVFADGQHRDLAPGPRAEGMPEWSRTTPFAIEAKAPDGTPAMMMHGPMMQALLEDRFKLKIHRETRDMAVFELVVAKGGPKLTPTSKGGCVERDPSVVSQHFEPGQFPCDSLGGMFGADFRTLVGHGATLARFAALLSNIAARPVIDKTGITGIFDINIRLNADPADDTPFPADKIPPGAPAGMPTPRPNSAFASALPGALAQLGLKLQPGKGGVDFLVIDHVERPSEN